MPPTASNPLFPFVIQEHLTPNGIHWDLMLQKGDVLWTWRITCPPDVIGHSSVPLPLERIDDHPIRFLTYEGPVQNKTGRVHLVEHGRFVIIEQTPSVLAVLFDGIHLKGRFLLQSTPEPPRWTITKA
jgi:hypothetical protein